MRTCSREGCDRIRPSDGKGRYQYCSAACRAVAIEMARAQRVCEAIGQDNGKLWASVVMLSDALAEYHAEDARLQNLAASVGISEARWFDIKNGNTTKPPVRTPRAC